MTANVSFALACVSVSVGLRGKELPREGQRITAGKIQFRLSLLTETLAIQATFASTAHGTQWSNYLTQWAEILTP